MNSSESKLSYFCQNKLDILILAFERDSKLEQKNEFNSPSEYRKERMRLYDQTLEHSPDMSTQKQDNFKQTRFDLSSRPDVDQELDRSQPEAKSNSAYDILLTVINLSWFWHMLQ